MFMNRYEKDIIIELMTEPFINQRILAEKLKYSLGVVNKSIKNLIELEYIDDDIKPTKKAIDEINLTKPANAIILAAGFGMRMVPINTEVPKGLLEINGERMIERLIRQLHEAGINEIYVVTGFMKEKYEYLIDEFGVELVVNPQYAVKNNLHSLRLVNSHISNTYIVPCDIYCSKNPFHRYELYSWYMVSDMVDNDSRVRANRKLELVEATQNSGGNTMIGVAYITAYDAKEIQNRISEFDDSHQHEDSFWEEVLFEDSKLMIAAKMVHSTEVIEINTYEQLRDIDSDSNQLKTDSIDIICDALDAEHNEITDITVLKKGMTNRSFLFTCKGKKYIMRIPGEGTEQLINRRQEAAVYQVIKDKHISDNIIYINPYNGYKITEYFENTRVCDPLNDEDLKKCLKLLKEFHQMKLTVDHEFNIFELIDFYEDLWEGQPSAYGDYKITKQNVLSLKSYIDEHQTEKILTHIDANHDNFLFATDQNGNEILRLIDWEYAGMQDPHVDLAMFCIYALYDREQTDHYISLYFDGNVDEEIRIKIYCYVAACGLLWSNWCEYKRHLGIEFGEYSLRQYRYAKDYYRIVQDELSKR